jgi:hypothetical protein
MNLYFCEHLVVDWNSFKKNDCTKQQDEWHRIKTATYELLDGFSNGFKIKYSGPRLALETKNLKSVFINPTVAAAAL